MFVSFFFLFAGGIQMLWGAGKGRFQSRFLFNFLCITFQVPRKGLKSLPKDRHLIARLENKSDVLKEYAPVCETHDQPLTEYYCDNKSCQQQLCVTCIVEEHKNHKLFSILKRKAWAVDKLCKKKELISKMKDDITQKLSELTEIKQKICGASNTAIIEVDNAKN